ncbi:MAG: hypothetical protein K2Q20_07175 [Phycisphaerales bacterium]|nr:hypothetical protein [Phycisphaerales bacterium]
MDHASELNMIIDHVAGIKARQLCRHAGLSHFDTQDIEHELWVRVLPSRGRFDPARATPRRYVNVLIDSKAVSLCREARASKRGGGAARPPDRLLARGACEPEDASGAEARAGHELRLDVAGVLASLDPDDRTLCGAVMAHGCVGAAGRLGIPLSTLRRRMAGLRGLFASLGPDAGLMGVSHGC